MLEPNTISSYDFFRLIDEKKVEIKINYLKTIKKIIKETEIKDDDLKTTCLENIKKELKILQKKTDKKQIEKTNQEDVKKFLDNVEKSVYNQPWGKLKLIHKIKLVEECVNNMDISGKKKQKLINKIINMIKTKEISVKDVTYKNMMITNIDHPDISQYFSEE